MGQDMAIIKASEIAQYTYCSVAWDLERRGAEQDGTRLNRGTELHVDVGMHIRDLSELDKRARRLALLGFALFILSIILGLWWLQ
jgi:ABC-type transport system involved in cytochrome c biogenesis permease subunit